MFSIRSLGLCIGLCSQMCWLVPPGCRAQEATQATSKIDDDDSIKQFLNTKLSTGVAPLGLPRLETRDEDPRLPLRVNLGRKLFFDKELSSDKSTSCATCHEPQHGFSVPQPIGTGVGGRKGRRNPPALINRIYGKSQFWDGRVSSLEEQALLPIESPIELNHSIEAVLDYLKRDESYREQFAKSFDEGVTKTNLAISIASFERVLLSGNSRIDEFVTAKGSALTKSERQGLWLYESKGRCWQCHSGKTYTDEDFHNTGVSWGRKPLDVGRFEFSSQESDKGRFKTPTLRDVDLTAPYMHDGSIPTLRAVVEFYNDGGRKNPFLDPLIKPLNLTDQEIDDLVAFLKALTGRHAWDKESQREK